MKAYILSKNRENSKPLTVDEIVELLGGTRHSFVQTIHRQRKFNRPLRYKGWSIKETDKVCMVWYKCTYKDKVIVGSYKDIAQKTNFAISTLYKHLNEGTPIRRRGVEYKIERVKNGTSKC